MDKEDEIFELVNDADEVIGTERRGEVHRRGLLHRAVYCWVFNSTGELLVQQRNPKKKIGPGQWDLSVAEHLQPGETYKQAVARGLAEELGICVEAEDLTGPLAPTHRRELHQSDDFHDVELVQSFLLNNYDGEIAFADGEVVAVRWLPLETLVGDVLLHPEKYTLWMREERASLQWDFGFANSEDGAGTGSTLQEQEGRNDLELDPRPVSI
jgi:isopentenyl-diphosphate Delta-isomerase